MVNLIVIAIVAVIVFLAGRYIYREKKRGNTCIGCPHGGKCAGSCSGCSDSSVGRN